MVWVWIPVMLFTSPLSAKLPHLHLLIILGIEPRDTLKTKIIETKNRPQWMQQNGTSSGEKMASDYRRGLILYRFEWDLIHRFEFWSITNEIWIIRKIQQLGKSGRTFVQVQSPNQERVAKVQNPLLLWKGEWMSKAQSSLFAFPNTLSSFLPGGYFSYPSHSTPAISSALFETGCC